MDMVLRLSRSRLLVSRLPWIGVGVDGLLEGQSRVRSERVDPCDSLAERGLPPVDRLS